MMRVPAVAYFRTSSATNVGTDKDSERRQREAVTGYAKSSGYQVLAEFYDAAVSGADPIDARAGFLELLAYMRANSVKAILVENASRFARDLIVQITGHQLLKGEGIDLIPVDAPDHFINETPTANMVRQILGAVAEFEKASLVEKLKKARDRRSAQAGRRIEGRPSHAILNPDMVRQAKRLARRNPSNGKKRSLREIAAELAALGYTRAGGEPFNAQSVKNMLERQTH